MEDFISRTAQKLSIHMDHHDIQSISSRFKQEWITHHDQLSILSVSDWIMIKNKLSLPVGFAHHIEKKYFTQMNELAKTTSTTPSVWKRFMDMSFLLKVIIVASIIFIYLFGEDIYDYFKRNLYSQVVVDDK